MIARFGWGRTYGYRMLASAGFPRAIGGRYRLDTLLTWEDRVLTGELPGRPDSPASDARTTLAQYDATATTDTDFKVAPAVEPEVAPDPEPVEDVPAPTRRRTRGTRRAA